MNETPLDMPKGLKSAKKAFAGLIERVQRNRPIAGPGISASEFPDGTLLTAENRPGQSGTQIVYCTIAVDGELRLAETHQTGISVIRYIDTDEDLEE